MSPDRWGRLAVDYDDDHTTIVGADLVRAVQAALTAAVPGGQVVELGCGTGLYTRAYAPRCAAVTAIDASRPMVERARAALAAMPNVQVRLADAVATGLDARSADAVVAVNLLHIVPDAPAVLAEARRLLRPGGVLVAADATGEGLSARQAVVSMWRILRRWGLMREKGQRNLGQASLEALVTSAGFESPEGHLLTGRAMSCAFVRALSPSTGVE